VVFCGVMNYAPNEEGAVWLAERVWPAVRAARPTARLLLVGTGPTSRLLALARRDESVIVTGAVPDVRPFLWQGAVAAAPLLVARGVQNKVLEAVGAGLPAVVTPVVAAGLPAAVVPACRVAADPSEFASALIDLLSCPPARRRELASLAHLDGMKWESRLAPFLEAIAHAPKAGSPEQRKRK
jgi:glycosyltransferase involved in cell wall biosynthesis